MKIRVGFEMLYEFPQPTPMIMVLGDAFYTGVGHHCSRSSDYQPFGNDRALP